MAVAFTLSPNGHAGGKSRDVMLNMKTRHLEAVDLDGSQVELAGDSTIQFSGSPQAARSAIAITYKPSNWEGFDCLEVRPSRPWRSTRSR